MKDYNLFYYFLEVATDASEQEINEAFLTKQRQLQLRIEDDTRAQEQGSMLAGDVPKWKAHLKHITEAHAALVNPVTRQAYHEERYPSSPFAEDRRRVLSLCAKVGEIDCWPPSYLPNRSGPIPTSYDPPSGCALFFIGFMLLAIFSVANL